MKGKKLFYFKHTIECCLLFIVIVALSASTYKFETSSNNTNMNKSVDLSTMALFIDKEEEERIAKENAQKEEEALQTYLWSALDSYTGDLTGYGPNCAGCSGRLAWRGYDVRDGNNTFQDKTYGTVYIVAASSNLPFGSIIRFDSKRISDEPVIAIVLDRGGAITGSKIDFLAPSEAYAAKYIGRSKITYDVLRIGWEK